MSIDLNMLTILSLALLVCECFGIFMGFMLRESHAARKKDRFRFIKSENGILRLDTTTGQVVLLARGVETVIHGGKRFSSYVKSFDLVETGGTYVLYDTSTGFYDILFLEEVLG